MDVSFYNTLGTMILVVQTLTTAICYHDDREDDAVVGA